MEALLINNAMVRVLADNKQAITRREGEGGSGSGRASSVKVGETVNAQVIGIEGRDTLSVKTSDGKVLTLRLEGMAAEFEPGDAISFKISDQQGEEFNAKLIKAPNLDSKQLEKSISDFLKSIDEKQTPLNKSIVNQMLDFGMPANKDSFKSFQNEFRFMQRISDILANNPDMASFVDEKSDLNEVVIKLIDALKNSDKRFNASPFNVQAASYQSSTSGIGMLMEALGQLGNTGGEKMLNTSLGPIQAGNAVEKSLMQILRSGMENMSEPAQVRSIKLDPSLAIPSAESLFSDLKETADVGARENAARNADFNRLVAGKYLELLNNQTIDKSIFLKKLNLTSSIFNMDILDKLVYGKDSMVNQLQMLASHLNASSGELSEQLKNSILNILKSDIADVDKNLKMLGEMERNPALISNSNDNSDISSKLYNDIRGLRESYEFLKSMADSLAFIQVPIRRDDEDGQLEIAYRKRREREDDGYRIFISLDTKNIGTVQSMIELNGRDLKIDFNVEDSLKSAFEAGFDSLRHVLEMYLDDGYDKGSVELGFFKRAQEMTAVDLFKSKLEKQSGFELQI